MSLLPSLNNDIRASDEDVSVVSSRMINQEDITGKRVDHPASRFISTSSRQFSNIATAPPFSTATEGVIRTAISHPKMDENEEEGRKGGRLARLHVDSALYLLDDDHIGWNDYVINEEETDQTPFLTWTQRMSMLDGVEDKVVARKKRDQITRSSPHQVNDNYRGASLTSTNNADPFSLSNSSEKPAVNDGIVSFSSLSDVGRSATASSPAKATRALRRMERFSFPALPSQLLPESPATFHHSSSSHSESYRNHPRLYVEPPATFARSPSRLEPDYIKTEKQDIRDYLGFNQTTVEEPAKWNAGGVKRRHKRQSQKSPSVEIDPTLNIKEEITPRSPRRKASTSPWNELKSNIKSLPSPPHRPLCSNSLPPSESPLRQAGGMASYVAVLLSVCQLSSLTLSVIVPRFFKFCHWLMRTFMFGDVLIFILFSAAICLSALLSSAGAFALAWNVSKLLIGDRKSVGGSIEMPFPSKERLKLTTVKSKSRRRRPERWSSSSIKSSSPIKKEPPISGGKKKEVEEIWIWREDLGRYGSLHA